jgi:hypothetical protein
MRPSLPVRHQVVGREGVEPTTNETLDKKWRDTTVEARSRRRTSMYS